MRSMLDSGLVVALSTDAPVVVDDNPFLGIQAAVTRRDHTGVLIAEAEAVTVEEALYAYTMGGALASGDSDNRASLSVGKWADLAVLDRDPTKSDSLFTASGELARVEVVESYVGGELRYSA